jgi:ketosteroid isomerase-like protein
MKLRYIAHDPRFNKFGCHPRSIKSSAPIGVSAKEFWMEISDRQTGFLPEGGNEDVRAFILKAYSTFDNPEKFIELFNDDAVVHVLGDPADRPYAGVHQGLEEISWLLRMFTTEIHRDKQTIMNVVIDGDRFAVRRRVEFRHRGTNDRVKTDIAWLVRLRDGKIADAYEFADTALIRRLGVDPE